MNDVYESLAEDAANITEMVNNVMEEINKESLAIVLSPFACAVIHVLLAEGKIKLC